MTTLYAWGANSYGQLGLGYKSDEELNPKQVDLRGTDLKAEEIISIAGGAGHTLILDSNGRVYCCGSRNSKGQLGLSEDTLRPTQIDILKAFKIVQISCGWDFSAAISVCGKLFVWGNNNYKQLGLSNSIRCTAIPSKLEVSHELAPGIKSISCGLKHSAIITTDGGLLVVGSGAQGQLGLGDDFSHYNYMGITRMPNTENVISVASGRHHTVSLRENGDVICWGENEHGQLGVNMTINKSSVPLRAFRYEGMKSVHAGWKHSAGLTRWGEVFTWGRFNNGLWDRTPQRISNFGGIRQLSVCSEHNLAVSKDNILFAWGSNEHGSCGTGDNKVVRRPRNVLIGKKVKLAFACARFSFAVVE